MIFYLIRQHLNASFAWRGSVVLALIGGLSPRFGFLLILPLLVGAILRPARATSFEAALPVHGRDVVVAHLASALLVVLFPLLIAVGGSALRHEVLLPIPTMLAITGAVGLAMIVSSGVHAELVGAPPALALIPRLGATIAACGVAIYLLPALLSMTLVLAAAIGAVLVTWGSIPAALQLSPVSVRNHDAPARPSTAPRPHRYEGLRPLLRSLVSRTAVTTFLMMVMWGVIGGFMTLLYVVIFTNSLVAATRQRTAWMNALPISPRARLLLVLLPVVVAIPGGLWIGSSIHVGSYVGDYLSRGAPSSTIPTEHYFSSETNVALEFWEASKGAQIPLITAPWGETAHADTMTVFGRTLFNPYSTREHSSERFVEWQFARATSAVYGQAISHATYDHARESTRVRRVTSAPRMVVLNGAGILALMLLLILVSDTTAIQKVTRSTWGVYALGIAPIYAPVAVDLYYQFRRGTSIIAPLAERFFLHIMPRLPSSAVLVALLAALPVVMLYAALERRYRRSELDPVALMLARLKHPA